jgi:hypothetical protein
MKGRNLWALVLVCCAAVGVHAAPATQKSSTPNSPLTSQAMTLVSQQCYSCHNGLKKKGGLSLATRGAAMKGSEDGAVLKPGDSGHSDLIAALAAEADPHMPPKKQLTGAQIAMLRSWIDAGAMWDEPTLIAASAPATQPIALHALPVSYVPAVALALSPDEHRLAAARGDRILIYDLMAKGGPAFQVEYATPRELIYSLAWSPDSAQLAAGGFRTVRVWNGWSSEPVRVFNGMYGRVNALAFSHDGTLLYAGDGDPAQPGHVMGWRVAEGEALPTWIAGTDAVLAIQISADGKLLFTADADKMVRSWDLPAGKEHTKYEGHIAQVTALALNKEGTQIASGSTDHEIKVWDVKTHEQAASMLTNSQGVTSLQWIDAKQVLSAGDDGFARYSTVDDQFNPSKLLGGAGDALCGAVATHDGTVYAASFDGTIVMWGPDGKLKSRLQLTAKAASSQPAASQPVLVANEKTISFASDVLPVLSRLGCNAGACHAKPHGQSGFKLSVFAYDPKSDYRQIVKDVRGRRIFAADPQASLLLQKPTMMVEHGGGKRLEVDSDAYRLLVRWIQQGMPYSRPGEPSLIGIEVSPHQQRYHKSAEQALHVMAKYSDGSKRDVTELADYVANDKELAKVTEDGLIRVGTNSGEGVIVARFMGFVDVARVTVPADHVLPDAQYSALPVNNFVDPLEYARLQSLGLMPSPVCSDGEFLRRASIDILGALPSVNDATDFLADKSADKRAKVVDRLLDDPRYGDFWASKWCDLLRGNPTRVGIKSNYVIDQWVRDRFRRNEPYDQFVREILLAEGSSQRDGPVVIYRDRREPPDLTTMFSQIFLGVRLECAKCHHHPNEKWSQDDFYQFAAFFAPLGRKGTGLSPPISGDAEYLYFAPGTGQVVQPVSGEVMKPKVPDGKLAKIDLNTDPRSVLADWMTDPANPFFAKALVNRVWSELLGRGIVEPVDDFRASNPATNDPLLTALAADFVQHHYDVKHLIRTIVNSRTYQLSSEPNETNLHDTKNFSRYYRHRPTAEALSDVITDVTWTPEPILGLPHDSRGVLEWNFSLPSNFLDAFGRPNSSSDPPCVRDRAGTIVQSLDLMNSNTLMFRISSPAGRAAAIANGPWSKDGVVTQLYLAALCRYPTREERNAALDAFMDDQATRQTATEDIMWSLINSAEFVLNH